VSLWSLIDPQFAFYDLICDMAELSSESFLESRVLSQVTDIYISSWSTAEF
jgi:hypothetical protein